jgi:hypothetical protein
VLEVSNLAGKLGGVRQSDIGTAIVRSIVHQQKFPIIVSLSQHAFDRLAKILLSVEEYDDARDKEAVIHGFDRS